jgi:HEAT repeat protein
MAARQAIQARMQPPYARFFAANISLIQRLSTWERVDHSTFLGWILEYLRNPECSVALNDLLNSPNSKTRRLIYRLLSRPDNEQLNALLHRALTDRDPTIRAWSIAHARKQLDDKALQDIAHRGIKDKYAGVRSHAAYIYAESFTDESSRVLKSLLMDPSPALRSIGRYYLDQSAPMDFGLFYRLRLESNSVSDTATAIRGLGEVGCTTDADFLASFAMHPSHKIRAATMHALEKLDGDRFVSQFAQAMLDASPSVSKEARCALSKRATLVDKEFLWTEYQKQASIITRKRILAVLFNTSKWDRLYYAVSVSEDSEPEVASLGQRQIERWIREFNRSGAQPTKEQHTRILAALKNHETALQEGTRKLIKFLLG